MDSSNDAWYHDFRFGLGPSGADDGPWLAMRWLATVAFAAGTAALGAMVG